LVCAGGDCIGLAVWFVELTLTAEITGLAGFGLVVFKYVNTLTDLNNEQSINDPDLVPRLSRR
jgi:hypothetical protein